MADPQLVRRVVTADLCVAPLDLLPLPRGRAIVRTDRMRALKGTYARPATADVFLGHHLSVALRRRAHSKHRAGLPPWAHRISVPFDALLRPAVPHPAASHAIHEYDKGSRQNVGEAWGWPDVDENLEAWHSVPLCHKGTDVDPSSAGDRLDCPIGELIEPPLWPTPFNGEGSVLRAELIFVPVRLSGQALFSGHLTNSVRNSDNTCVGRRQKSESIATS